VIHAAPTIEDVFAMGQRDRSDARTSSVVIRYDPTWGFPASVSIRCPDGWMDCGTSYSVTGFPRRPVTSTPSYGSRRAESPNSCHW
jgi:hypothetical protein